MHASSECGCVMLSGWDAWHDRPCLMWRIAAASTFVSSCRANSTIMHTRLQEGHCKAQLPSGAPLRAAARTCLAQPCRLQHEQNTQLQHLQQNVAGSFAIYATNQGNSKHHAQGSRIVAHAAEVLVAQAASQAVNLVIRPAVTPAELRAAAYLRAASFYTYPADRSEWAARSHRRMKADAEWEAITAKVEGTDPAYKDVTVTPFIAVIPDDPHSSVSQQVASQMMDRSTKLPADASDAAVHDGYLVVGTLDLNQGRSLPAEELQGKWPQPDAIDGPQGNPSMQRGYLSNVCVDKCMRRQGVAQRLIQAVEVAAAAKGITTMYVHVVPDNTPAVQLYQQSLGYVLESQESEAYARAAARPRRMLLCKQLS